MNSLLFHHQSIKAHTIGGQTDKSAKPLGGEVFLEQLCGLLPDTSVMCIMCGGYWCPRQGEKVNNHVTLTLAWRTPLVESCRALTLIFRVVAVCTSTPPPSKRSLGEYII